MKVTNGPTQPLHFLMQLMFNSSQRLKILKQVIYPKHRLGHIIPGAVDASFETDFLVARSIVMSHDDFLSHWLNSLHLRILEAAKCPAICSCQSELPITHRDLLEHDFHARERGFRFRSGTLNSYRANEPARFAFQAYRPAAARLCSRV